MALSFSIVTPSFNMLPYLQRCARSVADQEGVAAEHLVMDGGSTDGSAEWLAAQTGIRSVSERDGGMYDAVNKGLERATGDVLAYLNCDEQYLPGTLRFVHDFFTAHPEADLLFGDALLIRPDGSLLSYRKAHAVRWPYVAASHLYALSCTLFFRRRVVEDGFRFDPSLRALGDQDLVVRLLRHGYRPAHVRRYLAAFTMTGGNLSTSPVAAREEREAIQGAPWWIRTLRTPLNAARLAEKVLSGAYRQPMPLRYAVYASPEATGRTPFEATSASFRWRQR